MSTIQGNVDNLGPAPLHGWARDPSRPHERVVVAIAVDGVTAGEATADHYRQDLEDAGIGDGRHGFEMNLSEHIDATREQQLEVMVAGTGEVLWSGPTTSLVSHAAAFNRLRSLPVWAVNQVSLEGGELRLSGYVVPPAGCELIDAVFTVNGAEPETVEYPVASPDSCLRLWFVPGFRRLGFRCRMAVEPSTLFAAGEAQIQCLDRATGQPLRPHDSFFLPADLERLAHELPAPEQLSRVQGNTLEDVYLLWGFTATRKLDLLLEETLGRGLAEHPTILDWGCGCGRLTRHLVKLEGPRISGADIDASNLVWCAAHLPDASWVHLPMQPPAPWPDNTFDMVLGLSILTHLREADQDAWLAELKRISRPGATLALTVNGSTSMWWAHPSPKIFTEWQERGFSDHARDPAFDSVIEDLEYYRATFHSADYIRERWGQLFEVVEIAEAFAHIQDMVILRNPK